MLLHSVSTVFLVSFASFFATVNAQSPVPLKNAQSLPNQAASGSNAYLDYILHGIPQGSTVLCSTTGGRGNLGLLVQFDDDEDGQYTGSGPVACSSYNGGTSQACRTPQATADVDLVVRLYAHTTFLDVSITCTSDNGVIAPPPPPTQNKMNMCWQAYVRLWRKGRCAGGGNCRVGKKAARVCLMRVGKKCRFPPNKRKRAIRVVRARITNKCKKNRRLLEAAENEGH